MTTNLLKSYFPMIQSREEILARIYSNPKLQQLFESWTVLQQKEFLDFCSGAKGIKVLYEHLPRSESNKAIYADSSIASPPTQTPQGQPCLTGVGNNPLTITKPSRRAVSRVPKARRSRLSLTRCAGGATLLRKYLSRVEP